MERDEEGKGFEKLIVWQNAAELRRKVYQITKRFAYIEVRRVSQMRDAARSVKQNIQEGYHRSSLGEYIHSLGISKASLKELSGDIDDCFEDELISQEEFKDLDSLCKRTSYLFDRLLTALYKKKEAGTWKTRRSSKLLLISLSFLLLPFSSFFFQTQERL